MSQLIPLIEEFLTAMRKVAEVTEDLKDQASRVPSTSTEDLPSKVDELNELCLDGMQAYKQALTLTEDMRNLVGR